MGRPSGTVPCKPALAGHDQAKRGAAGFYHDAASGWAPRKRAPRMPRMRRMPWMPRMLRMPWMLWMPWMRRMRRMRPPQERSPGHCCDPGGIQGSSNFLGGIVARLESIVVVHRRSGRSGRAAPGLEITAVGVLYVSPSILTPDARVVGETQDTASEWGYCWAGTDEAGRGVCAARVHWHSTFHCSAHLRQRANE